MVKFLSWAASLCFLNFSHVTFFLPNVFCFGSCRAVVLARTLWWVGITGVHGAGHCLGVVCRGCFLQ
jgi:hypothetical protein